MPHQLPRQHWDSQRSWAQELEPWCLLVLQLHELTLNLSVVVSASGPGAPGHGKVLHGTLDLPTKERTWAWERGSAMLSAVSFYRVSSRTAGMDTTDLKETPVGTGYLLDQLFFLLEG